MEINKNFWKNKNVLITGHTGFKGTWLMLFLSVLGANISGISLKPSKNQFFFNEISKKINLKNSFYGDIRNRSFLKQSIRKIRPSIIFHLAAQSLVVDSYNDPLKTYETNIFGTINLYDIARNIKSIKAIINVTSDKCYEESKSKKRFKETDLLGGKDPYSSSKAASEIITRAYYNSFLKQRIGVATARAGNVIGGGDWSDNRLIPDLVKSIRADKIFQIRYPHAVRPWQHVLDPISGYILLMEKLYKQPTKFSSAWNFGPNNSSVVNVKGIIEKFTSIWGKKLKIGIVSKKRLYESNYLSLDISKSKEDLKWASKIKLNESIELTVEWYRAWIEKRNIYEISIIQVNNFLKKIDVIR